jgi:hypothetical protein
MNEDLKPQNDAEAKAGCFGMLAGLALLTIGGLWLLWPFFFGSASETVSISPDVRATPADYAVAQAARNTILNSCKTIEMVTPSDSGGYIIDCSNGDRYRMASGSSSAQLERRQ